MHTKRRMLTQAYRGEPCAYRGAHRFVTSGWNGKEILQEQEKRALAELCRIFNIRPTVVEANKEHALVVLTALYGNLSIENSYQRRRHRDEILKETDRVWGYSEFFGKVQGAIALMMVQPAWFGGSRSNQQLTSEFKSLVKMVFVLEMIGVSSLVQMGYRSGAKGVEELIKTSSVRRGIDAAKRRLILGAGSGILEAAATRMGMALGPWALVATGLLVLTYYSMLKRLEAIREEMSLRVTLGRATQQEVDALKNERFMEMLQRAISQYW